MALTKRKTLEGYDPSNLRMLIYGLEKIGKSTFCARADNALFLASERGLKGLEVYKEDIPDWPTFLTKTTEIVRGDHNYKTIIMDTVDNLVKYCLNYVCAKNKMDHPSDLSWGKGWDLFQREFETPIQKLAMSPYGLIFVSHAKETEVKTPSIKYTKIGPTMAAQARKVVMPLVDIIGYCHMEDVSDSKSSKERRVMTFELSEYWEAGDRTGLLPASIPLRYNQFVKYFDKK